MVSSWVASFVTKAYNNHITYNFKIAQNLTLLAMELLDGNSVITKNNIEIQTILNIINTYISSQGTAWRQVVSFLNKAMEQVVLFLNKGVMHIIWEQHKTLAGNHVMVSRVSFMEFLNGSSVLCQ